MDCCGDVSLILVQDRMIHDGNRETLTFGLVEDALQEAQNERSLAARLIVAHRGIHENLSHTEVETAGKL
jgi:hypothetical protein